MMSREKIAALALCLPLLLATPALAAEATQPIGTWGVLGQPGSATGPATAVQQLSGPALDRPLAVGWRTVAPQYCQGYRAGTSAALRLVATDRTYYDTFDPALIAVMQAGCISGRPVSIFADTETTWTQVLVNSQ